MTVRSKSSRDADERMKMRAPGIARAQALMISTCREACPNPCPLM
jgi:hypothetical protein